MKTTQNTLLLVAAVLMCGATVSGCGGKSASDGSSGEATTFSLNQSGDSEDDYHYDASKFTGPGRGPNGGKMVKLDNDQESEVSFDEEATMFSVYLDGLEGVSAVKMTTTIDGEETVYEFARNDTPYGTIYGLKSPDLATAVREKAETELTITTADGERTGKFELDTD